MSMRIGNKKYSQTKISSQPQHTINPQYLNFIRKNHLEFQHQEKFNSQIFAQVAIKHIAENSFKMLDNNNRQVKEVSGLRKMVDELCEDQKEMFKKHNELSEFEQQLIKNYKTIDILQQNCHQKYHNLGQTTIIPTKRFNHLCHEQQQPNSSQGKIFSSRVKSSINQLKQQIKSKFLYQDKQSSSQNNHSSQSQTNYHFATETQGINDKKVASQMKHNTKSNHNNNNDESNKSPLLMKKQKIKDLWKEKFLNWNYGSLSVYKRVQKRAIQNDIKFPSIKITKMQNKDRVKSKTQELKAKKNNELELQNCNLIRNSKPKIAKQHQHHNHPQIFLENRSLPVVTRSQEEVANFVKKHIELGLMRRQSSNRSYQNSSKNKIDQQNTRQITNSIIHLSPSEVSVMRRQRSSKHKATNYAYQRSEAMTQRESLRQFQTFTFQKHKKSNNYKQIVKQKQKQVQKYLLSNAVLKSAKIVNYYEKQQEKNKILFDEKHKDELTLVKQHSISLIERKSLNMKRDLDREKDMRKDIACESKQITNSVNDQLTQLTGSGESIENVSNQVNVLSTSMPRKKAANLTSLRKDYDLSIYEMKILSYQEFIFMMNLSHKVLINIPIKPASQAKASPKYTYFIGNGNNRLLIKSLMNRRYWWQETKDMSKANFVWTQLKVNELYRYQKVSQYGSSENMFDKLEIKDENKVKNQKKKKITLKNQPKFTSYKAPLPENHEFKMFTKCDKEIYDKMIQKLPENLDNIIGLNLNNRLKFLPTQSLNVGLTEDILHQQKMHNHLEFNYFIGNKKALFYNLHNYYGLLGKDVFKIIPYTLHIKKGMQDPTYKTFLKEYKRIAKEGESSEMKNIWIVKPGQLSNRGQGITVIDQVYELNNILKKKEKHKNGVEKSYILQKYIEKPLLYKNRKFDIRHYVLLTRFHGRFRAYFYGEGYIRTSSHQFKLDELDQMIHLTNDAIQKQDESYGKHEDGNKVSYSEFQRYLDSVYGENKHNFADDIYPKMKSIALDAVKSTYAQLDPNRLEHNFQLLGLDFMIDNEFNLWLIQVNTNPCLELSSKLLERLIPQMAEHSLRLCIDPMFPPPAHYPNSLKHLCPDSPLQRMQYELIFDEARDGQQLEQLFRKCNLKQLYKDMGEVDQQDATFENDGKQIELKNQKGEENS